MNRLCATKLETANYDKIVRPCFAKLFAAEPFADTNYRFKLMKQSEKSIGP